MQNVSLSLVEFAVWLLRVSGQASVVIGLVLLAQWLFQKKLSPRWRYCLWSLVLIRLMLPVSPGSAFSIFNYTQGVSVLARGTDAFSTHRLPEAQPTSPIIDLPSNSDEQRAASSNVIASSTSRDSGARTALSAQIPSADQAQADKAVRAPFLRSSTTQVVASTKLPTAPNVEPAVQQTQTGEQLVPSAATNPAVTEASRISLRKGEGSISLRSSSWSLALSLLWLGGALFLLARIIWFPLRLNAQLAQHETATGPAVFEILEQSKRLIGVQRVLPIVQSRAVASPALLGFIRPWLLLPDGMVERFTPEELRFVFLHELAHLKRRDIAVNWLMTILQILHWFNPLVWFAFARMRADRELACDELALSFAKADENKSYGQAIIKLLEGFTRPAVLPGLVGILEDKQQMKRRITMIAQFKQMTQWSAVAFALLLTLGLLTLTDAQTSKTTLEQTARAGAYPGHGMALKILLSGSGNDSQGVLSPDETKVAYVDWGEKSGDLMVKDLGTGKIQKVTNADTSSPKNYEFASEAGVWSPDSKSLAFFWFSAANDGYDLRVASADGSGVRVLKDYNPQLSYYPHDWSSDGKLLLVDLFHFKNDKTHALATVSVETGEVRQLISFDWNGARHPRFSPDGSFVVFDRTVDDNRDVYLLEVGGTQLIRLTDSPAEDGSPIFSPDGKVVLFSSNRGGTWHLWGIELKDGKALDEPMLIKPDFGDHPKSLTQNGKIAFSQHYQESNAYSIEINRSNGRMDGRPQPLPKSANGLSQSPVWSPDGKRIAYIRNANQLIIQTVANGHEEIVPAGMGNYINKVYWSPDGKWIALSPGGPKGKYGVHAYNLQTRELRVVYLVTGSQWSKGWSQDGTEFFSKHEDKFEANNLATGASRELFPGAPEPILEFDFSPDQKQIVYVTKRGDSEERVLAVSDRKFQNKRVLKTYAAADGRPQWPRWSPDGSMIAYYQRGQTIELCVTAADGAWESKAPRGKLKHFANLKPPEWSPDSAKLGMTLEGPGRGEIGVLENFLPKAKRSAEREAEAPAENKAEQVVKTLVSGTGAETTGVLSPDESKVAFTDFSSVSGDLAVKDLLTGTMTKLTRHDANRTSYVYEMALNLVWSPDSKWIAYTFLNDTNFSVRLAPAEGGESKVLKENPEILYWPFDWSQDGKFLLCKFEKSWDKSLSLGMISIETGEARQLISLEWNGLNHARFSPDGKFIVYDREENENKDIFVLALENIRVHRLTDLPSSENSPVWSSDGELVLFTSDRTGQMDLWGIAVKNGEAADAPFLLKRGFGAQEYRTTRSGKLAFTRPGGAGTDCYYFEVNPSTGDINGSPKLITTSFYGKQKSPAYSPDGLKVAYIRNRNPLCIQSLADGKVEAIKTDMQYFDRIFWSPDSKTVALEGRGKTGPLGIHLLNLGTHQVTQLLAAQDGVGYARGFSADGREFFFGRDGKRFAVDIVTREERTIEFPKLGGNYDYSPDGKQVVYAQRDSNGPEGRLIVSDSEFKESKVIARGDGEFLYRRWSPNGKMIAYNYNAKTGTQQWGTELRVSAADGSWQKTPKTGKRKIFSTGHAPSWSADGTKLALTLSEDGPGEIGVLENFLPKEKVAAVPEAKTTTEANVGAVVKTLLTAGVLAPDETKVVYDEWSGDSAAIFVKELRTGAITKVTGAATNTSGAGEFPASELVWSADSKQIAYCWFWYDQNKSTNSSNDLRIASASDGHIKVVKGHNPEIQFNPTDWSNDGQSLLCELKKKDGTAALATVSINSGEVRQLLSFPWETRPRHARFSPDGKFIAYERTENGNRDVYVLAVEGTQASRLTDWPSEESRPVWSPDGKHVLFSSNRSGAWELLSLAVNNGKAAEHPFVIRSDFGDRAKRMTRSGNLAFDLSRGGGSDVYLIDVNPATGEHGAPKLVTRSFFGQHVRSSWSADGKKLAYLRKRPEGTAPLLCVMSLADDREESFETGMRYMNSVFLSPDGKAAALSPAGKGDKYGIHLFTFETRELRPIVLSDDFRPKGFSSDGKEFLLFQAGNRKENIAVEIATGKERKIEFGEKVGAAYAVSPDGSRIVYAARDPGSKETKLILADIDFKDKQVIAKASTAVGLSAASLRWSPDGSKIAYPFPGPNKQTELRIRAADGAWERSVNTGKLELWFFPEWSPDSTKLALTLGEPGVSEIGILENFLPKTKLAAK